MHLDPVTFLWKGDDNDYQPLKAEDLDEKTPDIQSSLPPPPELHGKCILSVKFETPDDYARWKYYAKGRQWEFMVQYPAIMRAEYDFHNSLEVEMLAKKIVDLLQQGFDVYSANWKLEKKDEQK